MAEPAPTAGPAPVRRVVATRDAADALAAELKRAMEQLGEVLERETASLAAGRIRDGLAQETRKGELAGAYLRLVEQCRANAVALARFAPQAAAELRLAHEAFRRQVERNGAVIATARAISEGLVRGIADEMSRRSQPQGYGVVAPRGNTAAAAPLVFSGRF